MNRSISVSFALLGLVAVPASVAGGRLAVVGSVGYRVTTGAVETAFLARGGATVGHFRRAGPGERARERKT